MPFFFEKNSRIYVRIYVKIKAKTSQYKLSLNTGVFKDSLLLLYVRWNYCGLLKFQFSVLEKPKKKQIKNQGNGAADDKETYD